MIETRNYPRSFLRIAVLLSMRLPSVFHQSCILIVNIVCSDLLFGRTPDPLSFTEENMRNFPARFEDVHSFAQERIHKTSEKIKTSYDTKSASQKFHDDDKVWIWNPIQRKGLLPSENQSIGIQSVFLRLNDVVNRIRKSSSSKPKVDIISYPHIMV